MIKQYIVQNEEWAEEKKRLTQFFDSLDLNKDGEIDQCELKKILEKNNVDIDLSNFMKDIDYEENNKINFSEFLTAFYDFEKNIKKTELMKFFKTIDQNQSGFIEKAELLDFLSLQEHQQIFKEIFEIADQNQDGKISLDEFLRAIDNSFNSM